MSTAPLVTREQLGAVAILTLNRPEKRNALSRALTARLSDTLDEIEADGTVRVVVLAGAGSVFCAGMDLNEAAVSTETVEAETVAVNDLKGIAHLIDQVHRLPKPTVAAVHGDAYAGGAGLTLACDIVVLAEGAKLGYPEVRRGLVATVVMQDLVRQIGDRRARELMLTGESVDAATALHWGMVNKVVHADRCRDEALAYAALLIEGGPNALATTKRQLDEATRRPQDLRGAAAVSAAVRIGDEAQEGMRAYLEKRPTAWSRAPRTDS